MVKNPEKIGLYRCNYCGHYKVDENHCDYCDECVDAINVFIGVGIK